METTVNKFNNFNNLYGYVLLGSMVPFLLKAVIYLPIGSWVPAAVFASLCIPTLMGACFKKGWGRWFIKMWGLAMILFGLFRIGIEILFHVTDINEAHIQGQFTFVFNLIAVAYIAGGVYLRKKRNHFIPGESSTS